MKSFPDHYATLGLSTRADAKTIHARYRMLVKRFHPDTAVGDKAHATERFRVINEAYEVLRDADRRLKYDRERQQQLDREAKRTGRPFIFQDASNLDEKYQQAWARISQAQPHLEKIRKELLEIAAPLAVTFQVTILTSGEDVQASEIAARLKVTYMARYLDKDPNLLHFPNWLRDIPEPDLDGDDG